MIGCGALTAATLSGKGLTERWSRYGLLLFFYLFDFEENVLMFGAIFVDGE
jgi:hypothetical protein